MNTTPVKTAIVTGGHRFDFVNFHNLFHALDGVEPYVQHMDDFASSSQELRDSYEAIVFYIMLREDPSDEGQPSYAGKPKMVLEHLGDTEQGILVLHHAILAYPQWSLWNEIVGIGDRSFGFHIGQSIHVDVVEEKHPITRRISGWDMVDETYTMADAETGSDILLTAVHPQSMRTIGWTRQHGKARVFCLQSGHDNQTWRNASFREVLQRGIHWIARRF